MYNSHQRKITYKIKELHKVNGVQWELASSGEPYSSNKRKVCVDTMHLEDPLILFGYEASAITFPLFPLSAKSNQCSVNVFFNNDKGPFLGSNVIVLNGLWLPMCLKHTFIRSNNRVSMITSLFSLKRQGTILQKSLNTILTMSCWYSFGSTY